MRCKEGEWFLLRLVTMQQQTVHIADAATEEKRM
jgi:hypothetical protein